LICEFFKYFQISDFFGKKEARGIFDQSTHLSASLQTQQQWLVQTKNLHQMMLKAMDQQDLTPLSKIPKVTFYL
jgi:hypothetical protein